MNRAEPTLPPAAPDDAGAWPAGHRIGNFELQQALPRTGSARIYRAWDHGLSRPVAVKEYLPAGLVHRDAQGGLRAAGAAAAALFERGRHVFLDEARRLARCDHPALARVLQLVEAHGTAYCVMPWYAGRPVMDVPLALGGPLPEPALRAWMNDLLAALDAWHRVGGFHGGVHPGKTLLLDDGHGLLLAPGAAAHVAQPRDSVVSPATSFQPDEQLYPADGLGPGPWTDFHALAAVARYAITGLLPPAPGQGPAEPLAATMERLFWDQPAMRYDPDLLRALDAAMSPDAGRRPQTAGQFMRWLRESADTEWAPLAERPPKALEPPVPQPAPPPEAVAAAPVPPPPSPPPAPRRAKASQTPRPAGKVAARTSSLLEAAVQRAQSMPPVAPEVPPQESAAATAPAVAPAPDPTPDPAPEAALDPAPTPAPEPAPPPTVATPAPAAPPPSPPPAATSAAPAAPADEEVDAATAALIRQLIDDIPPAPAPAARRHRAAPAAAPLQTNEDTAPSVQPLVADDPPDPLDDDLQDTRVRPGTGVRGRLRDPRLVWALAASVALLVAGATAWQLRPRPMLNVTGDDLQALTLPGAAVGRPADLPASTAAGLSDIPPPPVAAREKPDAAPAAARARDAGPRQQCAPRTEFSLYRCMQQLCGQARWQKHAQCVEFKRTDSVQ